MATSYNEIKLWFERGTLDPENTHMIVVCDTFDCDDYPVYVSKNEDVRMVASEYDNKNMQKIMEVYNLKDDMEKQLAQPRCFNY